MELAPVVDDVLGPQPPQQLDLLRLPGSASRERHVEGFVLDLVPARADAKPKAVPGEDGELGGLLGDESRLPLGEDHHAGAESDPARRRRHEREQRERLVESHVLVVRPAPTPWPVGVRAEHMVVGQDVVRAQGFRALGVVVDRHRIGADLVVRKYDAEFHPQAPSLTACRK